MSQLTALYAAIAAASPVFTHNGNGITVYAPANLKGSYNGGDLPARVIIPVGPQADGKQGTFVYMGTALKVTWTIPDMLLLQPADQGSGISDYASNLIAYCGAYADLIRTLRNPVSQCVLENLSFAPGIYTWPVGSGQSYAGVLVQLDYAEYLT